MPRIMFRLMGRNCGSTSTIIRNKSLAAPRRPEIKHRETQLTHSVEFSCSGTKSCSRLALRRCSIATVFLQVFLMPPKQSLVELMSRATATLYPAIGAFRLQPMTWRAKTRMAGKRRGIVFSCGVKIGAMTRAWLRLRRVSDLLPLCMVSPA